jgi:hypothetical protein
MTPRMSIIAASIRKALLSLGIGGDGDYYWDKVVLAMAMNNSSDAEWSKTSAALHMNEQDPYWSSTVLAMHMDDDPYWSSVVLAMHMDGADSGTVFTDVKGKTCTAKGNAQTKTATKKFGTASGYFDGTGDAVLVSNSSDFVFGTGDFTIEFWVYPTNNTVGVAQDCLYYGNDGNNTDCWFVRYYGGGGSNPGGMSVAIYEGATTESFPSPGNFVYPNRWNHIVVVRKGGQKYQIINGKKAVATTSTKNHGTPVGTTPALAIGREYHDTYGAAYFTGYIDDVRITKGVGRYDSSFYPPQRAFAEGVPIDEKGNTLGLGGSTAISTTQKKFGISSAYFDGAGADVITCPHSTNFQMGSGDFTFEAWIYISGGAGTFRGIYTKRNSNATYAEFSVFIDNLNRLSFVATSTGTNWTMVLTPTAPAIGSWNHIACVRYGNLFSIFINGISVASAIWANTLFASTENVAIGALGTNGDYPFYGYIDDLRVTKGVARYTSNFTPSPVAFRDPITAPTFMDEKGNPFLEFGTPTLTATNAKFGGMSASFNGTTDYLRAVAVADFAFAAGDFTVEAWVRTGASGTVIDLRTYSSELGLFAINSGKASIWNRGSHLLGTTDLTTSTWFHLAWVRKTGVVSLYVNGKVEAVSPTDGDFGPDVRPCTIGADFAGANFFSGLIDDVRITKGVARYTGEFTPTNYSFLEPTNKPMFVEETGKSVAAYGNVVTTTPFKYGDAAASFDGTGDYLAIPDSTDFDFGSDDFTVEFWIYFGAAPSVSYGIMSKRATTANYSPFLFQINASRVFDFAISITGTSWVTLQSSPLTLSAWTHLACVRKGGTIELFVNGTSAATNSTLSTSALMTNTDKVVIGAGDSALQYCLNGSIDDLRITKGLARYLSNFTPENKQIQNYLKEYVVDQYFNNVVLGMHMDGADTGTTFTDVTGKTVTPVGNVQTATAIKKFGTASALFDGTGDYLSVPTSTDFDFGSGDFTVECWIYPTQLPTVGEVSGIFYKFTGNSNGWRLGFDEVGTVYFGSCNAGVQTQSGSSTVLAINKWQHVAVSRVGGFYKIFVNGIANPTAVAITAITANANAMLIGYEQAYNYYLYGYIDDVRITKGVGRYTDNFQPVQLPFPDTYYIESKDVSDPHWLSVLCALHMDGTNGSTTFTDVKGNSFTGTGAPTPTLNTSVKKFGTASCSFPGASGSYLQGPSSSNFDLTSSSFTIECWIYLTSYAAWRCICSKSSSGQTGYYFIIGAAGQLHFNGTGWGSGYYSSDYAVPLNKWAHVAVCQDIVAGTLKMFVNGVLKGSGASATGSAWAGILKIGAMDSSWLMAGYIDDFRFTKGVARYSNTFNPPTVFPEKLPESDGYWSSTNLAMHFDGTDNGTVFTEEKGLTVTRYGSIYTKTAQKKFGTASVQFTGNQGDCFRVPASANWDYGGASFTIEFWLYPTAYNANGSRLINSVGTSTGSWSLGGINWFVGVSSSQVFIQWHDGTTTRSGAGNISLNQWSHVAICGDGSQVRFFVNGVLTSISAIGQYLASREAAPNMCIGSDSPVADSTYGTTGYMDDLQLIKGQCRYKANFNPPTKTFVNG